MRGKEIRLWNENTGQINGRLKSIPVF